MSKAKAKKQTGAALTYAAINSLLFGHNNLLNSVRPVVVGHGPSKRTEAFPYQLGALRGLLQSNLRKLREAEADYVAAHNGLFAEHGGTEDKPVSAENMPAFLAELDKLLARPLVGLERIPAEKLNIAINDVPGNTEQLLETLLDRKD